MKKSLSYLLVGASVLALTAGATQVSAATDSKDTRASVEFLANTDDDIVKPGTAGTEDDFISVEGGASGKAGGLRMNFIPDINFGQVQSKFVAAEYPARMQKYQFKKGAPSGDFYIPSFAQVTDTDGKKENWKLEVTADKFMEDVTTGTPATLTNSHIKIKGATLTNTNADSGAPGAPAIADILGGVTSETTLTHGTAVNLMTTKDKDLEKGEGSKSSIVFGSDYTKDKTYTYTDKGNNESLVLVKPAGEVPGAASYKAKLTWTLTSSI